MICTLTPVVLRRPRDHSRMIKYSGGWELSARGLLTRGFKFCFPLASTLPLSLSLSLPLLPQCSCVPACTNAITTGGRSAFVRTHVRDWPAGSTATTASIKRERRHVWLVTVRPFQTPSESSRINSTFAPILFCSVDSSAATVRRDYGSSLIDCGNLILTWGGGSWIKVVTTTQTTDQGARSVGDTSGRWRHVGR